MHKILQTTSQEKEMAIGFVLAFSENPDKILDSIHSPADVDHLIAERTEYAKSQKVKNLKTKDPHVNISSTSSQNYESINVDTDLIQDPVNTVSEFIEGEVQIQNIEEGNIMVDSHDEIDLWELEQIPHTTVKFTEGQILEEFMLEEEIELQGIHKGKMVERGIHRETVDPPEMSVRIADEQEECIKEEVCNTSLPKLYRAVGSVHTDEIKLETPKINAVEINELPKEVK